METESVPPEPPWECPMDLPMKMLLTMSYWYVTSSMPRSVSNKSKGLVSS